jgi:protein TonB
MYALEEEPEKKGRTARMLTGVGVSIGAAAGLLFVAQHLEPARNLLPAFVVMAVVEEPLEDLPPPPPPPPPPPDKEEPKPQAKAEARPKDPTPQAPPDMPQPAGDSVGLDGTSFGGGEGGPSFRAGATTMGDPMAPLQPVLPPAPPAPPPKLVPARGVGNNHMPAYSDRARRLGVQGVLLIEAEIDERGRIAHLKLLKGLEEKLDQLALATVRDWRYEPASLGGRAVTSRHVIRIRYYPN